MSIGIRQTNNNADTSLKQPYVLKIRRLSPRQQQEYQQAYLQQQQELSVKQKKSNDKLEKLYLQYQVYLQYLKTRQAQRDYIKKIPQGIRTFEEKCIESGYVKFEKPVNINAISSGEYLGGYKSYLPKKSKKSKLPKKIQKSKTSK